MSIEITYQSSEGCDYGDREVTATVAEFVGGPTGILAELLVEQGVLSVEAIYEKYKSHGDYELKGDDSG